MSSQPATPNAQATTFTASNGYRYYVVWLLFIVYVFNFVDRQILTIVNEEIKRAFELKDWQLGALGGPAFAVLYCTLGIPIARYADRANRVRIVSLSLLVWSAFTAITGLAQNFWHLFMARIGVGIGEAGCSPPAYSIISDYIEKKKRATALSIYSMGVYAGQALGFVIGGVLVVQVGWRNVFYVVGVPGVILALIVYLTLREPPRGFSDATPTVVAEPPPFWQVLRRLWTKISFRHIALAAGLHAFANYGVNNFYRPFYSRIHEMSAAEVGLWLAVLVGGGGMVGTILGGWMGDKLFARKPDMRYYLWVPAITLLAVIPVGLAGFGSDSKELSLWMLFPYVCLIAAYLAPSIAVTHRLVGLRERALAAAVLLFVLNLIGLGLGPVFTGWVSDMSMAYLIGQGLETRAAEAQGVQWAILVTILINVWAATHYLLAARTVNQEVAEVEREQAGPAR